MKVLGKFKYVLYVLFILGFTFLLPRIIPGSPLALSDTDSYVLNLSLPEETFNSFKEYYAPDKPLGEQFLLYLKNILTLDLGYSFYYKMPVSKLIVGRLPWTILLSMVSLLLSCFIAIPLGIKHALSKKMKKYSVMSIVTMQAIPAFIVAIIIQLIFAYRLKLFPSSGAYTVGVQFFTGAFYIDVLKHMVLPLITLLIGEIPAMYILSYNSAKRIKDENYVKMASYLNIGKAQITKSFIFLNMIPELIGKLNIQFIYVITGSLFVETVFSYPGMGQLLNVAASNRDYILLQGILLLVAFYGLVVNFVFEIILKKFTPRY